jgi:hypothetical protein
VKTWLPGRSAAADMPPVTDDEGRQPDGSPAGVRLGRAGDQIALDLGRISATVTAPTSRSTRPLAEPGQLAHPQATGP